MVITEATATLGEIGLVLGFISLARLRTASYKLARGPCIRCKGVGRRKEGRAKHHDGKYWPENSKGDVEQNI